MPYWELLIMIREAGEKIARVNHATGWIDTDANRYFRCVRDRGDRYEWHRL